MVLDHQGDYPSQWQAAKFGCTAETLRRWVRQAARSIIGLFKTEVIRRNGPWRSLDQVEFATLDWVDWFNHERLLRPPGNIPPVEYEELYYQKQNEAAALAALT